MRIFFACDTAPLFVCEQGRPKKVSEKFICILDVKTGRVFKYAGYIIHLPSNNGSIGVPLSCLYCPLLQQPAETRAL
ncbi:MULTISPECIES: hypothetical protein [unclassified Neisseria]|uniref:hypothetical protein n=1 Tax=unclassified Neisseria TaxID=2623750 RepID=UPI001072995B|nr:MULTISPECIES: hypothetical protein [Neisseria]MBF0804547.1 hypothetical protein [Neisseria sp. 19428wB4_WF04]